MTHHEGDGAQLYAVNLPQWETTVPHQAPNVIGREQSGPIQ